MSDYRGEPGTIIDLIQRDHRLIKKMLDRFDTAPLHDWGKLFQEFVDYALRHEIAEAEVVFPALRTTVPGAGEVVDDCVAEQGLMEARLSAMEDLDPTTPEFREQLSTIRDDQSRHATHEEQVVLPMLRGQEIADLGELARSYDAARSVAPGHPAPTPGAGDAKPSSGWVAELADRIRMLAHRAPDR
jgi:hemerythrin-like domain-containing protein